MATNYLWVRSDLSRPQQTVQAAHALAQAAQLFESPPDTNLIVYGVENEAELIVVKKYLEYLTCEDECCPRPEMFGYYVWREPDIGNQITAICTEVLPDRYHAFRDSQLLM